MNPKFYVLHDIPGRIRFHIPALRDKKNHVEIEHMFSALKGITNVRIEPTIQTMLIHYDISQLSRNTIFRQVSIFFSANAFRSTDDIMIQIDPATRNDWLRTLFSGGLLLLAGIRKSSFYKPDALVYGAVVATGYMFLSHGTSDKMRHPDILTGIVTMLSLGPSNMLYVAMIIWIVNVLELLHEKQKVQSQKLSSIT